VKRLQDRGKEIYQGYLLSIRNQTLAFPSKAPRKFKIFPVFLLYLQSIPSSTDTNVNNTVIFYL